MASGSKVLPSGPRAARRFLFCLFCGPLAFGGTALFTQLGAMLDQHLAHFVALLGQGEFLEMVVNGLVEAVRPAPAG
jgi:hypothetical protein